MSTHTVRKMHEFNKYISKVQTSTHTKFHIFEQLLRYSSSKKKTSSVSVPKKVFKLKIEIKNFFCIFHFLFIHLKSVDCKALQNNDTTLLKQALNLFFFSCFCSLSLGRKPKCFETEI